MLAGGGLAHTSGGVGTLIQYLRESWSGQVGAPETRVIDTRGQGGRTAGGIRFAAAAAQMAGLCVAGRIDLVHAHMTTRGSVLRKCALCAVAMRLGVPVVVHMHGADFFAFYRRLGPGARKRVCRVLRGARQVIVLGTGWRDFLVRELGLDPARIAIVVNGVPCPAPAHRPAQGPGAPVRILFLGRIGDRKGVPELVAALANPGLRARTWRATIAGDGEVGRFTALAGRLGLSDRIDLPGWVDRAQTAALLAQADILVLPSHHEALPMAIIEALAHRVAVVATPVGVIPEFLTDDVDALLVPPGSPDALADALTRLIDDPSARARLADNGHAVFCERLDIAVTARLTLAIYGEATSP